MEKFCSTIAHLLLCFALHADDGSFYKPVGQWTNQGLLVSQSPGEIKLLSGKKAVLLEQPKLERPLPEGMTGSPLHAGRAFAIGNRIYANTQAGSRQIVAVNGKPVLVDHRNGDPRTVLWAWEKGVWERIGSIKRTDGSHPSILPLENGSYLVFYPPSEKGQPYERTGAVDAFFGIARLDGKGEFTMQSYGDLGVKGANADPHIKGAFRGLHASALLDDHLLVGCSQYGVFWVFSLRNGTLRRTLPLYDTPLEEMIQKRMGVPMFLNLQPLKDGTLLVAARDGAIHADFAKAMKTALVPLAQLPADAATAKAVFQLQNRRLEEVLVQFPLVKWFELDPNQGQVKRLRTGPPGTPDVVPTMADAKKFYWLPDEDGRIHMTDQGLSSYAREAWKPAAQAKPRR